MLKVGDKVKVLKDYTGHNFPIGSIVELEHIDCDGDHRFVSDTQVGYMDSSEYYILPNFKVGDKVRLNTNVKTEDYFWITDTMIDDYDVLTINSIGNNFTDGFISETEINVHENGYSYHPSWLELVTDDYKFKVGDKVRLNTDEESSDYYCITSAMIEDYDVLTIRSIEDSPYGGDGNYMIRVQENTFNYHSDWLELVDEQEEIGYTTITAVHFGDDGEYTWQCDRELFKDIKLLDLVLVDTVQGKQVVQVIWKSETLDIERIHKKVIKKLKLY